ncbi:atypical dual specificity phosphatase [Sarotherodon galilaeus]
MGCTSAKQVSAVPNGEEEQNKAYSNGDLLSDEYKMKGVEKVKYISGEEAGEDGQESTVLGKKSKKSGSNSIKLIKMQTKTEANFYFHIHSSESQQEFFRMLDEKIEKGRDYCSEEEDMT